jgi:hypothetical protein
MAEAAKLQSVLDAVEALTAEVRAIKRGGAGGEAPGAGAQEPRKAPKHGDDDPYADSVPGMAVLSIGSTVRTRCAINLPEGRSIPMHTIGDVTSTKPLAVSFRGLEEWRRNLRVKRSELLLVPATGGASAASESVSDELMGEPDDAWAGAEAHALARLPLHGIKVVDFGQYVAGPLAAQMLADQGADVVHIDPPGGSCWNSQASFVLNRNKAVVELDLKTEAGL